MNAIAQLLVDGAVGVVERLAAGNGRRLIQLAQGAVDDALLVALPGQPVAQQVFLDIAVAVRSFQSPR